MTTTKRLNTFDIKEAIAMWLDSKGIKAKTDSVETDIYLGVDPGDPPLSGSSIYAVVEVE